MKIALIDYYLDEWHANNYQRFFDLTGSGLVVNSVYGMIDSHNGITNKEWAQKNKVALYSSVKEAVEQSEAVMILAPDDPQTHLHLCKEVFPHKKRVYIDKPFADSYTSALRIAEIGDKYGTEYFSSSSLRFASEFQGISIRNAEKVRVLGMGEPRLYAVHQLEILSALGARGAKSVKQIPCDNGHRYLIEYENLIGEINFCDAPEFSAEVMRDGAWCSLPKPTAYFENLTKNIAEFFQSGKSPVSLADTMEIAKITEAVLNAVIIGDKILI